MAKRSKISEKEREEKEKGRRKERREKGERKVKDLVPNHPDRKLGKLEFTGSRKLALGSGCDPHIKSLFLCWVYWPHVLFELFLLPTLTLYYCFLF